MKQQLMLVAMLSVGTALTTMGRLKPALASLTPPVSYDYSYTWNATASEQYLNVNGVDSILLYTRTADGAYWNYTNTTIVIDGLTVTHTFNRSNTTWQASGVSWKPDENRIGSDNTVGSLENKTYIKFNNQTKNDYYLYYDNLSIGAGNFRDFQYTISLGDSVNVVNNATNAWFNVPSNFQRLVLSAYTSIEFRSLTTSGAVYFDAWYLKDLGISDAYQAGLDAETDGILTDYLGTDAQQIGWVLIGIAAILFAFKGGK
jgi:hypothetical protein